MINSSNDICFGKNSRQPSRVVKEIKMKTRAGDFRLLIRQDLSENLVF